jgi:hypothetical protein
MSFCGYNMTKSNLTNIHLETNLSEKITLIAAKLHCRPNDLINEAVRLFVDGQERIKNLEAQSLLTSEQKNLEEDWEANQDHKDWI